MTSSCRASARGFTLIELLVVITIIGLLAGLAFPAIAKVMETAKKAEASAMINQLRVSLTAYQTEYGTWPYGLTNNGAATTDLEVDSGPKDPPPSLYETLISKKTGTNYPADNPRGIVFMEFNTKVLRASVANEAAAKTPLGTGIAAAFVDPWNQPYRFKADVDYDNKLENLPGDITTINASLAIWSRGVQKTGWNLEVNPKKNFVMSWK